MDDSEFWVKMWVLGAATLLGLAAILTVSNANTNRLIAEMASKGIDPRVAACAIAAGRELCLAAGMAK